MSSGSQCTYRTVPEQYLLHWGLAAEKRGYKSKKYLSAVASPPEVPPQVSPGLFYSRRHTRTHQRAVGRTVFLDVPDIPQLDSHPSPLLPLSQPFFTFAQGTSPYLTLEALILHPDPGGHLFSTTLPFLSPSFQASRLRRTALTCILHIDRPRSPSTVYHREIYTLRPSRVTRPSFEHRPNSPAVKHSLPWLQLRPRNHLVLGHLSTLCHAAVDRFNTASSS